MYVIDAVRVLLRRWFLVVPGLLIVLGGGVATYTLVPPTYQSSGQLLFVLPPDAVGADREPINPYLNLDSGLTASASVVAGIVTSPATQAELERSGFSTTYAVAQQPGSGIPLLLVTVEARTPSSAQGTLEEVIRRVEAQLALTQEQVGAPAYQTITVRTYNVTTVAEALNGSALRAAAVVVGVGGLLVLGLTFLLDRLVVERRRRGAVGDEPVAQAVAPRGPLMDDDAVLEDWPLVAPLAVAPTPPAPGSLAADRVRTDDPRRVPLAPSEDPSARRSTAAGPSQTERRLTAASRSGSGDRMSAGG